MRSGMQCVILAGGLATRMRPITETIPKSLIPVHGRPFIDYQLQWLESQGISKVVLCIGYKGESIRAHLADRTGNLEVTFVDEGEELRGTAGALRLAFDCGVLDERFLLTYGDSFLPVSFIDVWRHFQERNEPALMTVFRNEGKWDKSNVSFENGRVLLYDKRGVIESGPRMDFIDYGLSALTREIVDEAIPSGEKRDLAILFNQLSLEGRLSGYEVDTRFYEIGSPNGLEDFSQFVDVQHSMFNMRHERSKKLWLQ
jgi:NDP-sugar pyrophosphorylase family protein